MNDLPENWMFDPVSTDIIKQIQNYDHHKALCDAMIESLSKNYLSVIANGFQDSPGFKAWIRRKYIMAKTPKCKKVQCRIFKGRK